MGGGVGKLWYDRRTGGLPASQGSRQFARGHRAARSAPGIHTPGAALVHGRIPLHRGSVRRAGPLRGRAVPSAAPPPRAALSP